jgi:hypothetical protein
MKWFQHGQKYRQSRTKSFGHLKKISSPYIFIHFCFLHFSYLLRPVQKCSFWSTLNSNPSKTDGSVQKTYFLQNAQNFLTVYCPKLSICITINHLLIEKEYFVTFMD